ncbi:MAG TPA: asparagine synthase-related protein [Clostridia bacterium]|nr:asparagine synthase-related protein [Clostridia bacterium]
MLQTMSRRFESYTVCVDEPYLCLLEGTASDRRNGNDIRYVFDARRRSLMLTRDHWGQGTLYYCLKEDTLYFSSEIKALFALGGIPVEPDKEGIVNNFVYLTPLSGRTVFRSVCRLEAGECLKIENGKKSVGPAEEACRADLFIADEAEAERLVRDTIGKNVKETAALAAGEPIAVYLSGGLDSTIILREFARLSDVPFEVFSLAFQNRSVTEKPFQDHVVAQIRAPYAYKHHTVWIDDANMADFYEQTLRDVEMPFPKMNPVALSVLADAVRDAGISMVATGEGADEMFYGYDFFKETAVRQKSLTLASEEEKDALIYAAYGSHAPLHELKQYLLKHNDPGDPLYPLRPRYEASKAILPYVAGSFESLLELAERELAEKLEGPRYHSVFERCQKLIFLTLLPEYLVTQQAGQVLCNRRLDGAFAFINDNMYRLSLSLKDAYKLKDFEEKYILKRAYRGEIPERILSRKKYQLTSPGAEVFLNGTQFEYLLSNISEENLRKEGIFSPQMVRELAARLKKTPPRYSAGFDMDSYVFTYILSTQMLFRIARSEWSLNR